jgi:hypothetical protein
MSTEANEKPTTGRYVPKHAPRGRRRIDSTMTVGFVAGALIAIGIAAASLLGDKEARHGVEEGAQRGLACPALTEAAAALNEGDIQAFREAVREAARIAEQTLQTSGQVLGKSERTALELRASIQNKASGTDITDGVLAEALAGCNGPPSTGVDEES